MAQENVCSFFPCVVSDDPAEDTESGDDEADNIIQNFCVIWLSCLNIYLILSALISLGCLIKPFSQVHQHVMISLNMTGLLQDNKYSRQIPFLCPM